jgi:hypothetical protein
LLVTRPETSGGEERDEAIRVRTSLSMSHSEHSRVIIVRIQFFGDGGRWNCGGTSGAPGGATGKWRDQEEVGLVVARQTCKTIDRQTDIRLVVTSNALHRKNHSLFFHNTNRDFAQIKHTHTPVVPSSSLLRPPRRMNGDTRSISAAALCRLARKMHAEALTVETGGTAPLLDAEDEEFVLSVFSRAVCFAVRLLSFAVFLSVFGKKHLLVLP